jgi:hypothetical protein
MFPTWIQEMPGSISAGPPIILSDDFLCFISPPPSMKMPEQRLKLGYERFFSSPFKFIIY